MERKKISDFLLNAAYKDKWLKVGTKKRAGVLVPLFSVYSKDSIGIGELNDIKLLVDWCQNSGMSIIQLLPMNEVGSVFCPYDSISSFALEPAYISLTAVSDAKKAVFEKRIERIKDIFSLSKQHLDYRIKQEKESLLWHVFIEGESYKSEEFKEFIKNNSYWILDFALFKAIKSYCKGNPWYEWPDNYKKRDTNELKLFYKSHEKEVDFQMWVQWQLWKQFSEVKKYAESKNVLIKGDLPILVSRDSADVWSHPEFFKLEFAAGAPPDMYCARGQRWGMPTYNWQSKEDDGFVYLKEKLKTAQQYYDILRIDHVVGLFRIWSIPVDEPLENQGLNGFFDPQDENLWKEHGKKLLTVIINNTKMLLCAEDLGIIPKSCPETLKELAIPGNDVQRWVKDWNVKHDFLEPEQYRALAVSMLSTHDTTNWAAWWENEAGTIDEALFIRKCNERGIDFTLVRDRLFNLDFSSHGRLRWLDSVSSSDVLVSILGKPKEHLQDFIDMYQNTFREKEKLWKHLGLDGAMREKCDKEIVKSALNLTLKSAAVFCIESIIDWLSIADIFKGDPYQYRFNMPGTVSANNWSLRIPASLEDLLCNKVNQDIKKIVGSSGRI
ncbi:MAG: 4-alpha-glucanotransferase [Candidatus Omnitrophota bacterium]